jgi:hypothetical protein
MDEGIGQRHTLIAGKIVPELFRTGFDAATTRFSVFVDGFTHGGMLFFM